ncbi:MAG: hypothetical protein WAW53_00630, partial [Candidatus Dormiibacterota bacterium]
IHPYHLAAPALVAAIPVAAALGFTRRGRRAVAGGAAGYALACIGAGIQAGAGETASVRVRIPGIFPVLHVAWGSGFWVGVVEAALRIDIGGGSPPVLPS